LKGSLIQSWAGIPSSDGGTLEFFNPAVATGSTRQDRCLHELQESGASRPTFVQNAFGAGTNLNDLKGAACQLLGVLLYYSCYQTYQILYHTVASKWQESSVTECVSWTSLNPLILRAESFRTFSPNVRDNKLAFKVPVCTGS